MLIPSVPLKIILIDEHAGASNSIRRWSLCMAFRPTNEDPLAQVNNSLIHLPKIDTHYIEPRQWFLVAFHLDLLELEGT